MRNLIACVYVNKIVKSPINNLPPESLTAVERFVEFVHEQARLDQVVTIAPPKLSIKPYRYPTVAVPASSLDQWVGLLGEGYDGDALADTEALYDEA